MTNYREISQQYAQQGINAAFLLNGGAAVALLSQAADLRSQDLAVSMSSGLLVWAAGTALAALTWVLAFLSTRYVDKSEREKRLEREHLATSDRYMAAGLISIIGSIALFGVGCYVLAQGF